MSEGTTSEAIDDLKARARLLQRAASALDPAALTRLRSLDELRELADTELVTRLQRRHCLAVVARELGFRGWPHAAEVLGDGAPDDFGTLLCPPGSAAFWNVWSASYAEARAIREEHGGYLLAYRTQFFVAERPYIEMLGLDPDDPDWTELGRDWARPGGGGARGRLYAKLLRASAKR